MVDRWARPYHLNNPQIWCMMWPMPKVSLYLPDDLLERIRAEEVGMTAVCQAALEDAVRVRELAREAQSDLRAVADRLRETERRTQAKHQRDGYELGVVWARTEATLDELARVERASRRQTTVSFQRLPTLDAHYRHLNPDWDPDPYEELDPNDHDFDRGLMAAAAEVYLAVRVLLDAEAIPTRRRLAKRTNVDPNETTPNQSR